MPTPKYKINRDFIYQKYINEKKSISEIAKILKVGKWVIHQRLIEFGIPRRKTGIQKGEKLSSFHKNQISKSKKREKNPAWKGGKVINDGYVYIRIAGHPHSNKWGYIPEHRLIAEKALGRYLKSNEIVHHINGKKDDNRKENLLICTIPYHRWILHPYKGIFIQDLIQEFPE